MNERGFTLVELVIAVLLTSIVLLGLGQFYISTARYGAENDAQAFLQRQATIIIDEMTRQIRPAIDLQVNACNGVGYALQATQKDGSVYCFYVDGGGQLLEDRPSGGRWNLLSGSPVSLTVTSFDLCGTTPPGTFATCQSTAGMAYVSFRLQTVNQKGSMNMRFTTTIARRN